MAARSICRLAAGMQFWQPACRRFHMDSSPTHHRDISEMFSEMISDGPHPSVERINRFMNAVYLRHPRASTLFHVNYRTPIDRSTIRGIRIGSNPRKPQPHKNVILVSGLPQQDPSTIGVNLYVAAMLSRATSVVPCDVSVIPLAHPREYERWWRRAGAAPSLPSLSASAARPVPAHSEDSSQWIIPPHETVTLDLKDTCKPVETYATRMNKYYVNIGVDLTTHGTAMQHKGDSLAALASRGKHRRFFLPQQQQQLQQQQQQQPPSTDSHRPSPPPVILGEDSLIAPMLRAPSLVLELRSAQKLDDDQIPARGEEVIAMIRELVE